ncbi:MAG TPA: hypothetical protein EYH35_00135, partial [Thiotrichaceae bacterium]|nr:hypothetical protein [Thiotrichaceae bacterium]
YTPEIIASRVYTPRFCFPIYRKPSAHQLKLSRDEITKGALNGQGLEIAWVDDPIALFYIHMQGSGVLKFSGGERKVLKFSASNSYRFKSIASYMHQQGYLNGDLSRRAITHWLGENPSKLNEVLATNPRYIYFHLSDSMPLSASGLPLIAGHTVAVDTKFIPFGSVLLAEIPQFDGEGKVVGYEWRMLLPQDRGNAIVGQARLDLYTGVGELAKRQANLITGARRTFLLLKKSAPYVKIFKSLQADMQRT